MKKFPKNAGDISRRKAISQIALLGAGISLTQSAAAITGGAATPDKPLLPFLLPPQPPLEPGANGLDIRVWVRSSQTNKQFSCVETSVAPMQMGPAPHVHHDLDEIMFVLEGTATVIVGEKVETIAAGGWHMRPRGIEHTFWNAATKRLRFIDMYFNQNFEDFLEELFHQILPDMHRQHLSPADPAIAKRLADLDQRFSITTYPEKRQPLIDKYRLRG